MSEMLHWLEVYTKETRKGCRKHILLFKMKAKQYLPFKALNKNKQIK